MDRSTSATINTERSDAVWVQKSALSATSKHATQQSLPITAGKHDIKQLIRPTLRKLDQRENRQWWIKHLFVFCQVPTGRFTTHTLYYPMNYVLCFFLTASFLTTSTRLCLCSGVCVCLSVWQCKISQKVIIGFCWNFWRGGAWVKEQTIRFWWRYPLPLFCSNFSPP